MAGIAMAESTKKKAPKTLDRLELKAQLGGGHIVRHIYSDYQHEPKEVKFNAEGKSQGGEHIVKHLIKHGGLPAMTAKEDAAGETESETEQD
jgi:hypothetical protein